MTSVATGLAAMDAPVSHFTDRLLTDEAAARAVGVSLATWLDLKRDRPPLSMFGEDIARYAKAHKAGGPGRMGRGR